MYGKAHSRLLDARIECVLVLHKPKHKATTQLAVPLQLCDCNCARQWLVLRNLSTRTLIGVHSAIVQSITDRLVTAHAVALKPLYQNWPSISHLYYICNNWTGKGL